MRSGWLKYAALAALGVVTVGFAHHYSRAAQIVSTQHVGEAAPATARPLIRQGGMGQEGQFTTAAWQGKPYLVNFFASWCPDCRGEHPQMLRLAAAHIPVIGIGFHDSAAALSGFLAQKGNPYVMVALDEDEAAKRAWGIRGVPETFVVDSAGVIRRHYTGGLTAAIIEQDLLPLWQTFHAAP
jgi:cytochrome c biogenesis protein CcmG/thiol:disulfide interchange protein DsbE